MFQWIIKCTMGQYFLWFLTSVLQQTGGHHFPVLELRSSHSPQTVHQVRCMLMELHSKINKQRMAL